MVNSRFKLNDLADDLAFVKRIMANEKDAVAFFLGTYSKPLLEYIGRSVLKLMPLPVYMSEGRGKRSADPSQTMAPSKTNPELEQFDKYSYSIQCYGEYYLCIAKKFNEMPAQRGLSVVGHRVNIPQWDKLGYYAKNPGAPRLYTYLSVITVRHFLKHHPDEDEDYKSSQTGKSAKNDEICSYDENERLYLILSLKLKDRDDDVVFSEEMFHELQVARGMLKTRDAQVIELTCFSDLSTMEIAEEMKDEFETAPSTMRKKDVQTRISQWKNRALVRLSNIITAEKNKKLFPAIMEYVRSKKK